MNCRREITSMCSPKDPLMLSRDPHNDSGSLPRRLSKHWDCDGLSWTRNVSFMAGPSLIPVAALWSSGSPHTAACLGRSAACSPAPLQSGVLSPEAAVASSHRPYFTALLCSDNNFSYTSGPKLFFPLLLQHLEHFKPLSSQIFLQGFLLPHARP